MKKEQIIKSMLFLIIPLFAISCDGNGLMEYEETALVQGDVQQGLLNDGTSEFAQDIRNAAQMLIDKQPTAYDVDKIVDQLEEEQELAYADFDRYVEEVDLCFDSECDDFFHKGLGRAIKVLKEGEKRD